MLGLVQNKGKETRKVSLNKEIEQIFWMQDLMKLKSIQVQLAISSIERFEDSANPPSWSGDINWYKLI